MHRWREAVRTGEVTRQVKETGAVQSVYLC